MSEKEFDVTLNVTASVRKKTDQGAKEWYSQNTEVNYKGMDVLQVTATNAAIVRFGEILAELGWDGAKLQGFPPELIKAAKQTIRKGRRDAK